MMSVKLWQPTILLHTLHYTMYMSSMTSVIFSSCRTRLRNCLLGSQRKILGVSIIMFGVHSYGLA